LTGAVAAAVGVAAAVASAVVVAGGGLEDVTAAVSPVVVALASVVPADVDVDADVCVEAVSADGEDAAPETVVVLVASEADG
jgi:hypothetical protein